MKILTVRTKIWMCHYEHKPRLFAEMEFPINQTSINAIIKRESLFFIRDTDNAKGEKEQYCTRIYVL